MKGLFRKEGRLPVRGLLTVVGGFLVHLTLGSQLAYGNINTYLVSYIRNCSSPGDLQYIDGLWVQSTMLMGSGVSMFLGGLLEVRLGPRLAVLFGTWFLSAGVLVTRWTIQTSYVVTVLTYGLMFGLGCGASYSLPLLPAIQWFPSHPGLVGGAIFMGFSMSGVIFTQMTSLYVNPDNFSPDTLGHDGDMYFGQAEVLDRVPTLFLVLGGTFAFLQLLACLMISQPPPRQSLHIEVIVGGIHDAQLKDTETEMKERETETEMKESETEMKERETETEMKETETEMKERETEMKTKNTETNDRKSETRRGKNKEAETDDTVSMNTGKHDRAVDAGQEHTGAKTHNVNTLKEIEEAEIGKSETETDEPDHVTEKPGREMEKKDAETKGADRGTGSAMDVGPLQMLRTFVFWGLWGVFLLDSVGGLFIISQYKAYGQTFITGDRFLSVTGSCASIVGALAGLFWGWMADRFTFQKALQLLLLLTLSLCYTLSAAEEYGRGMFFVWVCLLFSCQNGLFTLMPAACGRLFGNKFLGLNYGLLFTSQIVTAAVTATLGPLLIDQLGYHGLFQMNGGLISVALLITITIHPTSPDGKPL